ncbi:hypothetical protein EZI54_07095 [Marinobacter halodurans]|uniref:Uncharacterized protein n=1 Tax=Marinobacter halodurans TaxID=2528979 RepID=A0ABY1ZPV7_9GAMM|nr:hypothetical protein [Marinobacter halodurans]TBW57417.1 hypothetical protein EZI54_07095 [Marinobacter halodurans]
MIVSADELIDSLYRPYKQWSVPGLPPQNVILIKRENAPCIAACPELNLRCEDDDYLTATFALVGKFRDAMGIIDDTTIYTTCVPAFNVEAGFDVGTLTTHQAHHISAHDCEVAYPVDNILVNAQKETDNPRAEDQDQMDLFV